ncbi:SGT1 protein-domain-containing protein [Sporodiniella umbellata]|nr:SGT1 protein-domain-containing protein [Sporodiniella umbellata]
MKACALMYNFSPTEGNVTRTIQFTKTTYAQTVSQKFYAPKPFRLPSVSEKKKYRHAELGMKVACGLEMLYCQTKASSEEVYDFEADKKFASYLEHLIKLGYFKNERKGSKLYNTLEKQAKEQYLVNRNSNEHAKYVLLDDPDSEDQDIVRPSIENTRTTIDRILSEYTDEEFDKLSSANAEEEDSDDWMNVNPKQLEEMLFKKMMKDNDILGDLEGGIEKDKDVDLEALMSNLGNFVENKASGLEGIDLSDEESYDEDDEDMEDESNIKFDVNEFMRILKGEDKQDDIQSTMEEMDQEIAGHRKINGSFEKMSLDEKKGEDEDAPVDVELNLVKNILESFKSQQGLPGPASNILNQFGIVLPRDEDE